MTLTDFIRKAIEMGRRNGFVTFDQLNELVPPATTEPKDVETVMQALSDEGIDVRES